MRVFVTGAAGFIGFHLSKRLLEKNYEVIAFDNLNPYYDVSLKEERLKQLYLLKEKNNVFFEFFKGSLESFPTLESIFNNNKFDCVVNLAAQAGVRHSLKDPFSYIQSNIVGFENIIELSKRNKIKNFLYASSSSVYGGNIKMPFKEEDQVSHPISLYAATKRSNELIAHSYSHLFNLPTTGMRFFTVYGPWGRPDMALFLFTKAILNGVPINVYNNGDMTRDFTYVDDVVESIFRLLKKPAKKDPDFDNNKPFPNKSWAPYRIFNIGNSNQTPIMKYISEVEQSLGINAKINFQPLQPGDVKATYSQTSDLDEWINFKPKTSIKKGVKNFVDWYLEYYN